MKKNALGNNIRYLREKNNLSQLEFAKILNISNTTLSQYEAGNRIPNDEIKLKIADYFYVSLDFLLGRTSKDYYISNTQVYNEDESNLRSDIDKLSEESKEELEKYIQLLKLKDSMDKSKDEISSTLEPKIS